MKTLGWSRRLVTWLVLAFISSTAQAVHAKGEVAGITAEQVNQAVAAVQKLSADEIQKESVPGLAIAVVFWRIKWYLPEGSEFGMLTLGNQSMRTPFFNWLRSPNLLVRPWWQN